MSLQQVGVFAKIIEIVDLAKNKATESRRISGASVATQSQLGYTTFPTDTDAQWLARVYACIHFNNMKRVKDNVPYLPVYITNDTHETIVWPAAPKNKQEFLCGTVIDVPK
jgi:hypothetical protein